MASRRTGGLVRGASRLFSNLTSKLRHESRAAASLSVFLLGMLLFAPLPFASVLPRDLAILQVLAFLSATLALGWLGRLEALRPLRQISLCLLLLAAWGLLQSLPWPAFLVGLVSAPALANTQAGWALLGDEAGNWVAPSLVPAETRAMAMNLLALVAAFVAAGAAGIERAARRILLGGFLFSALVQVLLGAEAYLTRSGKIWGQVVAGDAGRLRGTFVNSDHFALYLGLAALLATSWLWWSLRRTLRERAYDQAILFIGPPLLLFLVFFTAVAFSGSRAGMIALILGLLAQGVLLALHYRRWQIFGVVLVALGLGVGGVALFDWQRGFVRFSETSAFDIAFNERLIAYRAGAGMLGDYWAVGSGLGTFDHAFPQVQPPSLEASWDHAHSDLLELVLTGGLPAAALLALGLYTLGRRVYQVAQEGRRSEDRAVGVAASGAFVLLLAFSAVDFGMTVPANHFTVAILLGLVASTSTGAGPEVQKRSGLTVFLPKEASSAPVGQG